MIVACPHCGSRYDVDATLFGDAPRTVKCSECGWEWLHLPGETELTPAPPAAADDLFLPDDGNAKRGGAGPDGGDGGSHDRFQDSPNARSGTFSFGDAMAVAQQAIAEQTGRDGSETALSPETGNAPAAASPKPGEADSGTQPGTGAAHGKTPPGMPADADDFEIELSSDDGEMQPPSPPPSSPPPPPRVPRWLVAVSAAAATVVILAVLLLLGRGLVLDVAPGTAGVYRMFGLTVDALGAGLEIGDVASSREWSDGQESLIVSGQITNTTAGPKPVPPLRVGLYNEADEALQSVIVPAVGKALMAGETTTFRARIAAPQETAQRIKITFDEASGS